MRFILYKTKIAPSYENTPELVVDRQFRRMTFENLILSESIDRRCCTPIDDIPECV